VGARGQARAAGDVSELVDVPSMGRSWEEAGQGAIDMCAAAARGCVVAGCKIELSGDGGGRAVGVQTGRRLEEARQWDPSATPAAALRGH
jgi:hypothetical protein